MVVQRSSRARHRVARRIDFNFVKQSSIGLKLGLYFWRNRSVAPDGVEGLGVCAAGKITSSTSHQMAQNAEEADGLSHYGAFSWNRSRTISHHEVPKSFWGADS